MEAKYVKSETQIQLGNDNKIWLPPPKLNVYKDPARKLRNKISREMIKILRHTAPHHCLNIRDDGYVKLGDLLQINTKLKKADVEMVKQIVAENDKKRMQIFEDEVMGEILIRAVQGHTIKTLKDEKMLTLIKDPTELAGITVVHGTNSKAWEFIKKTGLNIMSRNHVHFAMGYPDDSNVISGMKNSCDIFIELDVQLAMNNGIKIYKSINGVILSAGINGSLSPVFFKQVFKRMDTKHKIKIFSNENLTEIKQQFCYRYLFVLDFEANCIKDGKLEPQEIIEFPIVVVDVIKNQILDNKIFHYFIKPDVHKLTPFCTELTGITQETVDKKGIPLCNALMKFEEFVKVNKFYLEDCCLVTCGMWDLKVALKNEAAYRKIELNPFFQRFINIKEVFNWKYNKDKCGMITMLDELGLELEGKHHSGIDDTKNIAKIVMKMSNSGTLFTRDLTRFIK